MALSAPWPIQTTLRRSAAQPDSANHGGDGPRAGVWSDVRQACAGGGQLRILNRPVLSEYRYEIRIFRLPAVSIVFTSLAVGRRVRRISVGGLP